MSACAAPHVGDFMAGGIRDSLDAIASALVADAYGTSASDEIGVDPIGAAASPRAQSTPEREDENVEPGHLADPLDPRKGHRSKPSEPLPVEVPPVPKLRPLE
jgi:hypothetical protein